MVPQTDPRIAFSVLSPDIDQTIISLFLFYLVALAGSTRYRAAVLLVLRLVVGDTIDLGL
jgi:hypothetical protein